MENNSMPVSDPNLPAIPPVDRNQIVQGLRDLGLHPGSHVGVHSSLKSFGYVVGGAQQVIEALMEVVTPDGTLLFPSFNHEAAFVPGAPGYYSPLETPTINGAIPDLFWRMPGVHRSLDPTHPFAAWGKHSQRYVAHHHRTLTMGPDSPLGLLMQDDGVCLLLGVGLEANTFHHVVEMSTGAPCLGQRTEVYPVLLNDGRMVAGRTWGWRGGNCPFTDEGRYYAEMARQGLLHEVRIGSCRATIYRLQDCYPVIASFLENGSDGFPPCRSCPVRPRQVPQTVESDWDTESQNLRPDSLAWGY